jgi:hypothetical protein
MRFAARVGPIVFLLPALLAATGCASATLDVLQPLPFAPRAVSLSIEDQTSGGVPSSDLWSFRSALVRQLRDAGIAVVPARRSEATQVTGEIVTHDPGNRAFRFFVGFGAGTSEVISTWQVREATGDEVAACRIEGSVSLGTFGGSVEDVYDEMGRALVRFLRGAID